MTATEARIMLLASQWRSLYAALSDTTIGWKQRAALIGELRRIESDSEHAYAMLRRERVGRETLVIVSREGVLV